MADIITRQKAQENSKSTANSEISKVSVTAFSISAGLIGLWAMACLFSGFSNSGGPVAFATNLVKAILG